GPAVRRAGAAAGRAADRGARPARRRRSRTGHDAAVPGGDVVCARAGPGAGGGACMGLLRPMLGTAARLGAAALLCALAAAAFGAGVLDLRIGSLPVMAGLGAASGAILEAGWLWSERRRSAASAA